MSVGVFGATSLVGGCLLRLLSQSEEKVAAFSRQAVTRVDEDVEWRKITPVTLPKNEETISNWICAAPIWVLPDYFDLLEASEAKRVVALSSTSRFTKDDSSDLAEQVVARQLADGEAQLQAWAESKGIDWVILRPTMIYGFGRDKNIAEVARFIRRWSFFPLLGKGKGLRQPVHAEDVAAACFSALKSPKAANRAYNISGGETLTYREMVGRIFAALGRHPSFLKVPLGVFRLAVVCLRLFPRYRHGSVAMAERMNCDLVFEHRDAAQDFGFIPRPFRLNDEELP